MFFKVYLKYRSLFYHIKLYVSFVYHYLDNYLWAPRKKLEKKRKKKTHCSCIIISIYLKIHCTWLGQRGKV